MSVWPAVRPPRRAERGTLVFCQWPHRIIPAPRAVLKNAHHPLRLYFIVHSVVPRACAADTATPIAKKPMKNAFSLINPPIWDRLIRKVHLYVYKYLCPGSRRGTCRTRRLQMRKIVFLAMSC